MFKKYYKDANNDIKADEAFINSVIENARKKRVPSQKSYYKYALTAAAAVVVLSATAVTMPLLTDNNDDGVISVVTQTAQPEKDTVPNTPTQFPINTAVPTLPETVKKTTPKAVTEKETKSDKQQTEPIEKKEEKKNEQDFRADKTTSETKQEIDDAVSEIGIETNGATLFSVALLDVMPDTTDSGAVTEEAEANTTENNKHATGGGGRGTKVSGSGGSIAAPSAPRAILPPSGYYVTEYRNGKYVFTSDTGAVITVTTEYTNGADTAPVYNGLNVSFTAHGVKFNITSDGAEQSAIDELVNSLR